MQTVSSNPAPPRRRTLGRRGFQNLGIVCCGAVVVLLLFLGATTIVNIRNTNRKSQQEQRARYSKSLLIRNAHGEGAEAEKKRGEANAAEALQPTIVAAEAEGSLSKTSRKESLKAILSQLERVMEKMARVESLLKNAEEREKVALKKLLRGQRSKLLEIIGLDTSDLRAVFVTAESQRKADGTGKKASAFSAKLLAMVKKSVLGAAVVSEGDNSVGAAASALLPDVFVNTPDGVDEDELSRIVLEALSSLKEEDEGAGPTAASSSFPEADAIANDAPARHRRFLEETLPKIRSDVQLNFPLRRYGYGNYSGDNLNEGRIHRPEEGDADISKDVNVVGGSLSDQQAAEAEAKNAPLSVSKVQGALSKLSDSKVRTGKIFVSLASFRDSECSRTILDMFTKAKHPQRIYVGAAEQHLPIDGSCIPHEFLSQSCQLGRNFCPTDNIRIRQIDPLEARGPVYGRYMAQLLYRGEDYYFMLDSHTRFSTHWDTRMIEMYENLRNSDHYRTEIVYSGEEPEVNTAIATEYANGVEVKDLERVDRLREAATNEQKYFRELEERNGGYLNEFDIGMMNASSSSLFKGAGLRGRGRGGIGDIPIRYDFDINGAGIFGGNSGKMQDRAAVAKHERKLFEKALRAGEPSSGNFNDANTNTNKKKKLPPRKIVFSHYPEAYPESTDSNNPFPVDGSTRTAYLCRGHMKDNLGILRLEGILTAKRSVPLPQPFAAAGFLFADASLLQEVPFDPYLDYIFDGEEILYSARMWTSGWDMFSPSENLVYHIYGREKAPKYWSHGDRSPRAAMRKSHAESRVQYFMRAIRKDAVPKQLASAIPTTAAFVEGKEKPEGGVTDEQFQLFKAYSTTPYRVHSSDNANASSALAAGSSSSSSLKVSSVASRSDLRPYQSSALSANRLLIVDDGMLSSGVHGKKSSTDTTIDESKALPWYVTAEEDKYGMGTERSLEAYYEFAGINPYTYEFTKDWCATFA